MFFWMRRFTPVKTSSILNVTAENGFVSFRGNSLTVKVRGMGNGEKLPKGDRTC